MSAVVSELFGLLEVILIFPKFCMPTYADLFLLSFTSYFKYGIAWKTMSTLRPVVFYLDH